MTRKVIIVAILFSVVLISSATFAGSSLLPPGPPTGVWFQFHESPDKIKAGERSILAICYIYAMQDNTYLSSVDIDIAGVFNRAVVKNGDTGKVLCRLKRNRAKLGVKIIPFQPLKLVLEGFAPGGKKNRKITWSFSNAQAYADASPVYYVEGLPFEKEVSVHGRAKKR